MKCMVKRGLGLTLAVMLIFLYGCSNIIGGAFFLFLVATGDDLPDKAEVFEFVGENEEALLAAIESGDFSEFENKGFIQDIDVHDAAVEFYCGGAGIGSNTAYAGFFYSAHGNMAALWNPPPEHYTIRMLYEGRGVEWREKNGDNRYYVEHICGNFYYYEESF